MISLNENHNATKYVYEHNKMSINIPEKDLLRQVDFAGMYSSKEVDKSGLVEYEIIDGLPIVNKAPISLIVKTKESIKIKQRVVFVCEVIETIVEDKLIRENRIDLSIVEPILYGLDNIYYSGLTKIGVGYQEGKKLNE
jgi:flavin reductase (DIM6/NTAB) family NADH-FMN oxidoreductase RutF